jgi:two-component system, NtrC family, sensor kinase
MAESDRKVIAALAAGRLPDEVPPDCEQAAELRALVAELREVQALALALGRGELAPPATLTRGPVIGSLKALHAALRHLTWQAQRVAEGDLSHRVDFMGEFSQAFNEMVRQLAERTRLEGQLRQAQKLEAVGQLAAGLAHELNTPAQYVGDSLTFLSEALAAMAGALQAYRSALDELAADPRRAALVARLRRVEEQAGLAYLSREAPEACASARQGVDRIAAIVGAMKQFAQPDQGEKAPADLNRALLATLTVAHDRYQAVAEVETELGQLPQVSCHVGELNQAFLALVTNAADAIGEVVGGSGTKGRIRVRTRARPGAVEIEVEDTGCGIPAGIRERVFDPFFTTKDIGRGSGQGLSVARSVVVDGHQGSLTFESEVGRGTTFRITLPMGDGAPASRAG